MPGQELRGGFAMKVEVTLFKARYVCKECEIGCFREEVNTTGELVEQPSKICERAEFTAHKKLDPMKTGTWMPDVVRRATPEKWTLTMTWTTLQFSEVDHSNKISIVTHHHPDFKDDGMRMEVQL